MYNKIIEEIIIERNKRIDKLIYGEIQKIATEHGIDTKIVLNEKAIVSALEKQIPKKPILEYHKEPYPKNYGMMIKFLCPNCGRFIVAMYEIDVEDGRMRKDLKGCPTCLQAIDFTEYYNTDKHNGKLDEELGFKE